MKKGKHAFFIILMALMIALALLSGCGSETPASEDTTPDSQEGSDQTDPPENNAEISEKAMQNFLDKLQEGNYVMNADGFLRTTVCSKDLVCFYYDDEAYSDYAVMSVDNEVFQGIFEDNGVRDVLFVKEGSAMEAAEKQLPNCWMSDEFSGGNIYNLFYNDTDDPLKFVSYDANVQNQLRAIAGYGEIAMNYMHEVYLILDKEDPEVVHLQAEVDDDEVARYYFDDIDVTVTFGDAQTDARADSWMKAPTYPAARTEWTESDIFIFNSVFLPGYGEQAIPYIPFASYALSVDEERFISDDTVYIRDPHATQEDIEAYKALLAQNGFEEAEEDGATWYRRMLRDETKCYSSISVEYNDGLDMIAGKYYDFPKYEGFDQINGQLAAHGYPELPETEALTDLTATDVKSEQTESWLYFFNYDVALYVYAGYEDYDEAMSYLNGYAAGLADAGYSPVYVDGEEGEVDHYRSEDGSMTFRYHFEDDETVILLYKAEKLLTASEVQTILADEGFPELNADAEYTGRDHTKFEQVMYGKTYKSSVSVSMSFETSEKAEEFLDRYVAALEDNDFMRVPASDLGSNKNNGYTVEEAGLGVAFDYIPGEDGGESFVNFDFKSGIDFSDGNDPEGNKPILGSQHLEEIEAAD